MEERVYPSNRGERGKARELLGDKRYESGKTPTDSRDPRAALQLHLARILCCSERASSHSASCVFHQW